MRFKRLVIGSPAPHDTAKTYQDLFGLPEVEVNGGPRTMLGWPGGSTLLMVPASEVGGMEGMVALSMVAPDMPPLVDAARAGPGRAAARGGRADRRAAVLSRSASPHLPVPLPLIPPA